jgi:hypothetical protein
MRFVPAGAPRARRTWRELRLPLSLGLLDRVARVVCHLGAEKRAEEWEVGHGPAERCALRGAVQAARRMRDAKGAVGKGVEGADECGNRREAHQEQDIDSAGCGCVESTVALFKGRLWNRNLWGGELAPPPHLAIWNGVMIRPKRASSHSHREQASPPWSTVASTALKYDSTCSPSDHLRMITEAFDRARYICP